MNTALLSFYRIQSLFYLPINRLEADAIAMRAKPIKKMAKGSGKAAKSMFTGPTLGVAKKPNSSMDGRKNGKISFMVVTPVFLYRKFLCYFRICLNRRIMV